MESNYEWLHKQKHLEWKEQYTISQTRMSHNGNVSTECYLSTDFYFVQFQLETKQLRQHCRKCGQHDNLRNVVQKWICWQSRDLEWTFQLLKQQWTVAMHYAGDCVDKLQSIKEEIQELVS